jgi:DNA segregation ATPase FtsK/SpoIIIE, S-DNA-T family
VTAILHDLHTLAVAVASIVGVYLAVLLMIWVRRFILDSPAARRHYWLTFKVWVRWSWLLRNLELAKIDRQEPRKIRSRSAFGPTIGKNTRMEIRPKQRVQTPKVRIRPDDFGFVAKVRTIPRVGRTEFEKASEHLANAWRCVRVQTYQTEPGRLVVRGMRRDPLAEPLSMADVPPEVYTNPHPFRPYVGRDEWGVDRFLELSGITGMAVAGLPRYGKTALICSLLMQLGGTRQVQFVILDGKGSGEDVGADYDDWIDRAWMASGDDLDAADHILTELTNHMAIRGQSVRRVLGVRNGWHVGPSDTWPLVVLIVDECHTFFDEKQAGTDRNLKAKYLRLQSLAAQLVKKSGSVMMLSIFITQKQTGDAIPTSIRDNCTVGLSFAVKTRDAAVAGLGEGIRDYPSLCPTGLKERPTYVGVCTAALPDGFEDYTRLRVPYVTDEASTSRAQAVAGLRANPIELLAPALTAVPDQGAA